MPAHTYCVNAPALGLALNAFSLIGLRHAAAPAVHSSAVRVFGLLIPALAAALNTFPLDFLFPLCQASTLTYALRLRSIPHI